MQHVETEPEGRYFVNETFKLIFLFENCCIFKQIYLRFVLMSVALHLNYEL